MFECPLNHFGYTRWPSVSSRYSFMPAYRCTCSNACWPHYGNYVAEPPVLYEASVPTFYYVPRADPAKRRRQNYEENWQATLRPEGQIFRDLNNLRLGPDVNVEPVQAFQQRPQCAGNAAQAKPTRCSACGHVTRTPEPAAPASKDTSVTIEIVSEQPVGVPVVAERRAESVPAAQPSVPSPTVECLTPAVSALKDEAGACPANCPSSSAPVDTRSPAPDATVSSPLGVHVEPVQPAAAPETDARPAPQEMAAAPAPQKPALSPLEIPCVESAHISPAPSPAAPAPKIDAAAHSSDDESLVSVEDIEDDEVVSIRQAIKRKGSPVHPEDVLEEIGVDDVESPHHHGPTSLLDGRTGAVAERKTISGASSPATTPSTPTHNSNVSNSSKSAGSNNNSASRNVNSAGSRRPEGSAPSRNDHEERTAPAASSSKPSASPASPAPREASPSPSPSPSASPNRQEQARGRSPSASAGSSGKSPARGKSPSSGFRFHFPPVKKAQPAVAASKAETPARKAEPVPVNNSHKVEAPKTATAESAPRFEFPAACHGVAAAPVRRCSEQQRHQDSGIVDIPIIWG
eukprot:jgi/Mesvir1/5244/Mv15365-RA.1